MPEARGFLDLVGTPSLVSTGTNKLIVGTNGAASLVLVVAGTGDVTLASGSMTFAAASYKIIPGATSLLFRNNADTQTNLTISDAGVVTPRGNFAIGSNQIVGSPTIIASTSDGADNAATNIYGGGGSAAGRGAHVGVHGNEETSGILELDSGDATGSTVQLHARASNGAVTAFVNSLERWRIDSSGVLTQEATNGGNLLFQKADTGVRNVTGNALTAAGTIITDALQLAAIVNNVTTVGAGSGVKLSDTVGIGTAVFVKNRGANALLVYPPNASGVIDAASAGVAVSVATNTLNIFVKVATNTWVSGEIAGA